MQEGGKDVLVNNKYLIISIIAVLLFWPLDILFNLNISYEKSVVDEITHPTEVEIYLRPVISLLIILLGVVAHFATKAEKILLDLRQAKIRDEDATKSIQISNQRIQEIVDSSFDGIITMDSKGFIEMANPAACTMFGYTPEEMRGKNAASLTTLSPARLYVLYLRRCMESGRERLIYKPQEFTAIRKDGSVYPVNISVSANNYSDGWMFTATVRDISEDNRKQQSLKQKAVIDPLTHLYNRGYFNRHMEREFRRSKRYNVPLSLIMLDIDHFKNINDTYGHLTGDKVLIELAARLNKLSRDVDIVARYGGEEFVLILPETNGKACMMIAERLRAAIEGLGVKSGDTTVHISISLGLVSIPETEAASVNQMVSIADQAMYRAKQAGRNQIVQGDAD